MSYDIVEEIKKRNDLWMKSYKDKKFESFECVYAADCKVMPPGSAIQLGREAARKFFQTVSESGIEYIELKTVELIPMGNEYAMDRGTFHMFKEKVEVNTGKYIVMWRLTGGTWFMEYDCFNNDK